MVLLMFCADIVLHIIGYGFIYLSDYWNMVDAVVILLNILFVIIDSYIDDGLLKNILKLRGLFRLVRIIVLMRKIN